MMTAEEYGTADAEAKGAEHIRKAARKAAHAEALDMIEKAEDDGFFTLNLSDFRWSVTDGLTLDGMPADEWYEAMTEE